MVRITIISILFAGCASQVTTICPYFPVPKQEVLDILENLNNPLVDSWIKELYKLNLKLKVGESDG